MTERFAVVDHVVLYQSWTCRKQLWLLQNRCLCQHRQVHVQDKRRRQALWVSAEYDSSTVHIWNIQKRPSMSRRMKSHRESSDAGLDRHFQGIDE